MFGRELFEIALGMWFGLTSWRLTVILLLM
jgi:hypothetical protein